MRSAPRLAAAALVALLALPAASAAGAQTRPGYDEPQRPRADDNRGDDAQVAPSPGQTPAAELVRQLNLRPDQQAAFRDYHAAFQEQENEAPLDDPQRLQDLTAPQRLDATAQQMERDRAAFDRIAAATRRFYAGLDPAQRREFDRLTAPPLDAGEDEEGAPSAPSGTAPR